MAGITSGDVEILVHTTAPSRGQDDARYRALAQAYLDFEPATRQRLEVKLPKQVEEGSRYAESQLQGDLALSTQEERESKASYRPHDEEEECEAFVPLQSQDLDLLGTSQPLESPELSFNSAINNADSPVFRGMVTCEVAAQEGHSQAKETQSSSTSWEAPKSVISDSQPEQQGSTPAFASPARVLDLYLRNMNAAKEGPRGIMENRRRGEEEVSELHSDSEHDSSSRPNQVRDEMSSQIEFQSSPLPIKSPTRRLERILDNTMASTQDPTIETTKKNLIVARLEDLPFPSSAPTKLTGSSSPPPARPTKPPKRHQTEPQTYSSRKNSDAIPSSKSTEVVTSSAGSVVSPWSELLEIRPAPPQTSMAALTPELLITEDLLNLSQKMPLSFLYRPISQSRELRPMERGYWMVNCRSWNDGLRSRSWNCLGNFIGKDMAGWGVSVIRSENHEELRVYCWGIIVGHIYLLLHLASEGKVKGTGACWRGGDGEAIIKMQS